MYKCEILADSISPQGHRITTYKVTYPRIIHAEMCRHRVLSRNSASSRAIPFEKMVKMAEEDPFIPIAWQKYHKGMQGIEYFTDEEVRIDIGDEFEYREDIQLVTDEFKIRWLEARDKAVNVARGMNDLGLTKQLCNRLLEPFLWHTELISATEWENFFKLRCPQYSIPDITGQEADLVFRSKKDIIKFYNKKEEDFTEEYWRRINKSQAEIHIQAIAELMWDAMSESTPKQLKAGEWHIPFGDKILNLQPDDIWKHAVKEDGSIIDTPLINARLKIATARCARISYETLGDNPKIDYESDIKLHDMLLRSKHMSPFEHCARAMTDFEYNDAFDKQENGKLSMGWCNNFRGWIQYRYLVENK